ncbi:hypothetical protein [Dysgonomonas gadei]|uniref:hypothetical protein n=1 Tax=Dysgonomonas gadei TaxID=156974 RepID=UPI003AF0C8EC
MKKLHIALLLLAALFFVSAGVQAQFTAAPNVKLGAPQIQGERMPRLTTAQRNSMPITPFLQGVIIFNKDTKRQEYWDGKKWVSFGSNPWYDVNTNTSAGADIDSIYHLGPVTIGSMELSVPGAILQMKNKDGVTDDAFNSTKGMALPRVVLSQKKELFPMFLTNPQSPYDPNDPTVNPPIQKYVDNKATWDKSHTGLIVYNLTENDEEELCLGLNQWDGEQWNCFETKMGNAIAHIESCDEFKIFGQYKSANTPSTTLPDNFPLDASNFITIKLDVEKPGAYTLNIVPSYAADINETNGYFFTASGVFMEKGMYTVTIPGMGTPFWYTPDTHPSGDVLNITMNNKPLTLGSSEGGSPCVKNIKVQDYSKKPNFEIDCGRTTVHGVYTKNMELNPGTNYLSVWIKIDPNDSFVEGATVYLETNEVEGIRFVSTPSIVTAAEKAAGEKEIILAGSGKPTTFDTKRMTISSNSVTSVATCYTNVIMFIPKKRIYTLGVDANYGYNIAVGTGTRKVLTASANFGTAESSIVKTDMANYDIIVSGINGAPVAADIQAIKDELANNKPDILYITQDFYITEANGLATPIIDYLNKGGVVVCIWEGNPYDNGGAQILFRQLFGNQTIKQTKGIRAGGGSVYAFTNINDEILNGPFGDVRGKHWGEDASWAMTLSNLPVGDIDIYSYATDYSKTPAVPAEAPDPGNVVAFKHKTLNLIYVGDGGFTSAMGGVPSASAVAYPFYWNTSTMAPIAKTGYGEGTKYDVYNSQMWCNVMAWAIKTAQFKGINTPK